MIDQRTLPESGLTFCQSSRRDGGYPHVGAPASQAPGRHFSSARKNQDRPVLPLDTTADCCIKVTDNCWLRRCYYPVIAPLLRRKRSFSNRLKRVHEISEIIGWPNGCHSGIVTRPGIHEHSPVGNGFRPRRCAVPLRGERLESIVVRNRLPFRMQRLNAHVAGASVEMRLDAGVNRGFGSARDHGIYESVAAATM